MLCLFFSTVYSENETFVQSLEDLISQGRVHDSLEMTEAHLLGWINKRFDSHFLAAAAAIQFLSKGIVDFRGGEIEHWPKEEYLDMSQIEEHAIALAWTRYWKAMSKYTDKQIFQQIGNPIHGGIKSAEALMAIMTCEGALMFYDAGMTVRLSGDSSEHPWHPCEDSGDVEGVVSMKAFCSYTCYLRELAVASERWAFLPSCSQHRESMLSYIKSWNMSSQDGLVKHLAGKLEHKLEFVGGSPFSGRDLQTPAATSNMRAWRATPNIGT